ncbi:MAG: sensor histidine kinase [Opitutaceae bacterium]
MSPRSFSCPFFRAIALSAAIVASAAASPPVGENPGPVTTKAAPTARTITTIAEAFARWPTVTSDDTPVQIEGVVIGTMPNGAFRLHDGELGIYVTKSAAGGRLEPRDRVSVSGVLRQAGFSPWMTPHRLVVLGRGTYPEAQSASYSVLASGVADNQWLEIEGVVRAAELLDPPDFVALDLCMTGGNLRVLVNHSPGARFDSLVDAEVRLRGVAAVNVNTHGHVVEPTFRVPSFAEVAVTQPAPTDAFSQPLVPVARVMRSSQVPSRRHRVRTSGVVTRRVSDTMFFVRDGSLGLKVETQQPVAYRPGDAVEAAGFPAMSEGLAVLQYAVSRVMSHGPPPEPSRPAMAALLEGLHNSDLVGIRARLVDWVVAGSRITLIFQAGDHLFKGLLIKPESAPLSLPEKNSLVNVTGVCIISELEDTWFYQPRSFLLLLADFADVELVQAPPWWTPERLWRALAIACAVLLTAASWVWLLRRQIDRKRAVIEQQARHAAALEERSRIARELHDTLEQGLTGLSLQMKAMETDLGDGPSMARSRLQFARQMLRQSRALARNAVREMRVEATPARLDLVEGLKRIADSWNHSGALTVEVRIAGNSRPLPPQVERHLLGIGTEAMTNAVKHGCAGAIRVEVDFRPADIAIRIKDNGVGFDPAQHLEESSGCFGLLGMRERVRELRGEIHIHSQPGQGAEIVVTAPLDGGLAMAPEPPPAPSSAERKPLPCVSPPVGKYAG